MLVLLFSSSVLTSNLKQSFGLNILYKDSQFHISSTDLSLKFQTHISHCLLNRISERYSERKGKGGGEVSYFQQIFKSFNLYLPLNWFLDEKIYHYEKCNYPKSKHIMQFQLESQQVGLFWNWITTKVYID